MRIQEAVERTIAGCVNEGYGDDSDFLCKAQEHQSKADGLKSGAKKDAHQAAADANTNAAKAIKKANQSTAIAMANESNRNPADVAIGRQIIQEAVSAEVITNGKSLSKALIFACESYGISTARFVEITEADQTKALAESEAKFIKVRTSMGFSESDARKLLAGELTTYKSNMGPGFSEADIRRRFFKMKAATGF
jgi:hypothetical protein